ncbi:MAG: hypothetical protein Q4G36_03460 [Paracoccus sp. (in: a-proteobacteria)]|nr:hypothetical protein [Paracoccus sp. (in: a-proteobacteria)]
MRMTSWMVAGTAVLALGACEFGERPITKTEADLRAAETTAPAEPTPISGPVEPANSLNGLYNLQATSCGDADSTGQLEISGNRFNFHQAQCTATDSNVEGGHTSVSLSCSDSDRNWSRQVQLRLAPGQLQLTEDRVTLTYYRCPAV